jgi:hypothetical protein
MTKRFARTAMVMFVAAAALIVAPPARAQETTISITVKNHRFQPAEVHAPANVPIVLRVEKVVTPNSEGIIRLRPLAPGSYNFFDDFNQEANGVLVVK